MPPALFIANTARVNGYTGKAVMANQKYWPSKQVYYPTYHTFYNEVTNYKEVRVPSLPPVEWLGQGNEGTVRGLSTAVAVDDGLDSISYPIATIDTCDCVYSPPDGFILEPCSGNAYWGCRKFPPDLMLTSKTRILG